MDETSMRMPDGRTVPYAVLGHPIGHTLSPLMHNTAFLDMGLNAVYLAFDVVPEQVPDVLASLRAMGFGGVNLTIPLKETAYRCLDRRDASAELVGSVNTVAFTSEGMTGHSTDGEGFLRAVREAFGSGPEGRTVFVLGAGGAGRAVALTAASSGASGILLSDADGERARAVADEIRQRFPSAGARAAPLEEASARARDCDWIVQATPLGLRPEDPLPFPPETFRSGHCVYDLVYGREETPTTRAARTAGAEAATGLGMLLHQGVRSFEIWTGRTPPVAHLREVLRNAARTA